MSPEGSYRSRDDEPGALDDIRVIDLTIARAGPTCVRQLADLGADVIHVGTPVAGDFGGSDAFNLNRNKRSILVDLKQPAGRDVLYRLVERADVFVENFRSSVKERLGFAYEDLARRNPRLVYASISGFGQDGPYGTRPGLDQIAQGMGGLMSVTGPPGTGPWRAGIAVSDTASGTFLAQGILAALYARERTGRGQYVHTSLLESMVNFMDFQAVRWLVEGEVPGQAGNDHPTLTPMGTFATADGCINIAVLSGWDRFCRAIGAPELLEDGRFVDFAARAANREALRREIEVRLARRTSAEWIEILCAADLPCGPILRIDEVFADPQVEHLNLTRTVRHPRHGEMTLLRHPVTFSDTPTSIRTAPPVRGAHSEAILAEHGFEQSEIAALLAGGAVLSARERAVGADQPPR